jgi:hypothetical protein
VRALPPARAAPASDLAARLRTPDGLYIGTYSNFFTDPSQIRGVIIFCGVLASFFSLGNIGAALLLPVLYDKPIQWCVEAIVFGYPCK